MPTNSLQARQVRAPRLRVLTNGALAPNPISADINSNNHYAADRFGVVLGLAGRSAARWCAATDLLVDVQMSLDAGLGWTSLVQGSVDTVEYDPLADTIRLLGRDLTAGLIEARTQETFANQTASEIAKTLAGRHGLDPDIATTSVLVGRYWELEHDRITLDQFGRATTEWDLLVTLAQHEGFNVWVSGTTLHFRPADQSGGVSAIFRASASAAGPANVTGLHLERTLTLARDIEVTVKSWNSHQKTAFIQVARASAKSTTSNSVLQKYVYVVPNLTPDAALKLAQQRRADLTRRERVISVDLPGELHLRPRMQVQLVGTNTAFDQSYWIDAIERRLDFTAGFTERIRASNSSAGPQTTSPADRIGSSWIGFSTP